MAWRPGRPDARRLRLTLVLIALLLAPALGAAVLDFGEGGIYLVIGTMSVVAAGIALGPRVGLVAALGAGCATGVTLVLGAEPWAAALWLAVLGAGIGLASVRGLEVAVSGAAMAPAILAGSEGEPWIAVAVAVGGAYGALVAYVLARGAVRPRTPLDPRAAVPYALVLAAGLGFLTGATLALDVPHGYWAPVAVLGLAAPWPALTTRRAWERVAGTLVGSLAALTIAVLVPNEIILLLLAIVVGFAGLYYLELHARRTALLTAAIVLLGGSGGEADVTALLRVGMVGAAVACIVLIAFALGRVLASTPGETSPGQRTD